MKSEYDYVIKTLLIGDSGVGKSSIMNQFVEEQYSACSKWAKLCQFVPFWDMAF